MAWIRLVLSLALRSVVNPATGVALLRVGWRFRDRRWYRRFPFLPLPSREYMRWRMHTEYGNYDAMPTAGEIVRYTRWAVRDP